MAPVSRRKRPPVKEPVQDSIFDSLNLNPDTGKQRETPVAKGPTIEELQAKLAEQNARMEEIERANLALTTAAPRQITAPVEPTLNLEGLPDPLDKAYGIELSKRIADHQSALGAFNQQKQQAAQATGGNAEQLWQDFNEKYGSYAEDKDGIEFVVTKVLKDAAKRGMDLDKYRFQNSDRFFRDVISTYDKRFGKPEEEEMEDIIPIRRRAKAANDEDGDDGRSSSIFGGNDGGANSRAPAQAKPTDMIKDLQDIQRKTGYW